jgi:gliding motility-associated-like protein
MHLNNKKGNSFFRLHLFSLVATVILLILLIIPESRHHYTKRQAEKASLPLRWAGTFNTQKQAPTSAKPLDTTELKQSNWYADALQSIHESEYEIKFDEKSGSYASPNRSQNIRSSYTGKTFTLQPRKDSADTWRLELSTKGIYAGDSLVYQPNEHPKVTQQGNSIQFQYENTFITEYINNTSGVRQNFIIEKEPLLKSKTISVKLEANEEWVVNKVHSKEIHFAKAVADGYDKKLTYNQLKVWDANKKELEASFSVDENIISINVNTNNAVYPVTIDPVSSTENTLLQPNQTNAQFGRFISSAGDVNGDGYSDVVIGAWLYDNGQTDEGVAFVFHGSATGLSTTAAIMLEADQAGASFGSGVSGAGDINNDGYSDIIVGAFLYDNGQTDEGAAFVYYGSALGITATPAAVFESNQANAQMGFWSDGAGDINGDGYSDIVIGAHQYDNGQTDEGAVFVYKGSASGIVTAPVAILESNQDGAFFGREVKSAGDVNADGYSDIIVGAYGYDNGQTDEGAAYIFHGNASGINTTPAIILESNQATSYFGQSAAGAGDVNGDGYSDVIVGAAQFDNTFGDDGASFIYYGSATGINATAALILYGSQASSRFGYEVSCAGDINGDGFSDIVIGSYFYDNGQTDEGAAYMYYGSSSGIITTPVNVLESNQSNAIYGIQAKSAGDVNGDGYSDLIIGAYVYDNGQVDEGAAFVYHGSPDGLSVVPLVINNITQNISGFGYAVATAGDVNNDGFSDVIISAPWFDDNGGNEGRAFVYYGSTSGISITANVVLDEANQGAAYFGYSLGSAGDVNGDGFSDVIVGALGYNGIGRAYIYFGSASGLSATSNQVLDGTQAGEGFGVSVATAGDVNHDGYSDVIIGAYSYNDGANTDEGRALIYHGSAAGLITTPVTIISDANQPGASFGFSTSTAGDVNGDGYSDIMIGSYLYDNAGNTDQGAVFVYYGSCTGISSVANLMITGAAQANAFYGFSLSSAGDINGDGFGDVVVASFGYNSQKGRAYIYNGSAAGLSSSPFLLDNTPVGNNNGDRMGMAVSTAGDLNGDGYSDIIIGIPEYNNPGSAPPQGRAFVYFGKTTGVNAAPDIIITDNVNNQQFFGHAVAAAGDVNGDGYSDIVAGGYKGSFSGFGMAWIYKGNNTGGLRNNLRLYNTNLATPMTQSNINDGNSFGAGLYAKSFLGKQKGKLVWQTIANGNVFTGSPITNSTQYTSQQIAYSNLGLNGVELKTVVAKNPAPANTYIRARIKYDPVTSITGQVYGPWKYIEGYQRGSRAIADAGMTTLTIRLGNDTTVCFPYTVNATTNNATSYTWQNGATGPTFNAAVPGLYWVDILLYGCTYRDTIVLGGLVTSFATLNPVICQNQTYTSPSGNTYNTAGIYQDTIRSIMGCDSVIYTIDLSIQNVASVQSVSQNVCAGQTYTLPWGTVVSAPGIYRDTLRYVITNCDSVYRIIDLSVQMPVLQTFNPVICLGQTYTLPWGTVVNTAGVYRDTLHYTTGCDSVRRTVNLTVQAPLSVITNPTICVGQSYTLPWGTVVNTPGVYVDTLRSIAGCDSIRRIVNLAILTATSEVFNPIICEGASYTLPWGAVVSTAGIYRDTLHGVFGCDSIRRIVNLTVQSSTLQTTNPVICAGQTYALPWGTIVNAAGVYRDTLHYTTGCDSVRRIVNLIVQSSTLQTTNPIICAGQTYTLPWGTIVNTAGVYRDTLHYTTGCDSLRRTVNLTIQTAATTTTTNPVICAGQTYTLPWGAVVNTSGVYRDTLHYTTGCDSIRRVVNLTVQPAALVTTSPVICQGASYTLPWGTVVNTAGIYRDTLHYTTGCDSVRRIVNLQVTAAAASITNATICSGENYTLPWGVLTNIAGVYKDTARTRFGCDSLIRTVNLRVDPAPSVSVTRSNDVDCMLGIAKLEASGGVSYAWTPAASLDNATIYNPVASPTTSTWYKVLVTSDKGCTTEDSVQVKVITGNIQNGYLVPNAFTPNGDGKNDCFGVQTWGAVTDFEFSIFSRWGERVFFTKDPKQCWDGRYKGTEQSSNVFVYQIRAKGLCGDIYRRGTVTLIR